MPDNDYIEYVLQYSEYIIDDMDELKKFIDIFKTVRGIAITNNYEGTAYCYQCDKDFNLFINRQSEEFHEFHDYLCTINAFDVYNCKL